MTSPVERAAYALRGTGWESDYQRARAVFASIDPDDLAQALADDWNLDRDPILTAMFRDYAQTVIAHLTGKDQT